MADDSDSPAAAPVGWPLVERRRSGQSQPYGTDRRLDHQESEVATPTLSAAPLWPFRLAALAGALVRAVPDFSWDNWSLLLITAAASLYTVHACARPVPYRNDPRARMRVVTEQALNTAAVMLTGAWGSPFVLFFVPTGMLAGFAAGGLFSASVAAVSVAVVTVQHVPDVGARSGLQDGALWAGLLGLVAFTSGLAHRAARDAARQQQVALDRVSRLAEANSLLFALQRVAQTLPASLDLEEVLDSTVGRLSTMVRHDTLAVFITDPTTLRAVPVRTLGIAQPRAIPLDRLPEGLNTSVNSPKTVRLDGLAPGTGVSPTSRSGLYAALRARGALVGMLAVESDETGTFGQQEAEVVHGLSEPFGIAIDNARMFLRIRTMAADEERKRIARDLHDLVGSSLAQIGFEVDRVASVAHEGGAVEPLLREVRQHVSAVITDVRDTLYDLRTEVTDARDLCATTADLLARVQQRSGILTDSDMHLPNRLSLLRERDLWQIVREAILNAERHSKAKHLNVVASQINGRVTVSVRDDGVGLDASAARHDSYGLIGMGERAERLDADLTVRSLDEGGTEMRIELSEGEAP